MRFIILSTGATLAIAACSPDQATEQTANADADLTAQSISANDTTAIDAVTNSAANMAADVTLTQDELANLDELENQAAGSGNAASDDTD